jgi:hypothetical protein
MYVLVRQVDETNILLSYVKIFPCLEFLSEFIFRLISIISLPYYGLNVDRNYIPKVALQSDMNIFTYIRH